MTFFLYLCAPKRGKGSIFYESGKIFPQNRNFPARYFAFKNKCSFFAARFQKTKRIMSKVCQITGKRALIGNNVSHSKRRTKKKFNVNLFYKRFYLPEEDEWIRLRVSASGLRLINKVGLQAAMNGAKEKGYL